MRLIDHSDLTPEQQQRLLDLHSSVEQRRFAGDVATTLYLASVCQVQQRCLVMVLDDEPCGVLLLQRGAFLPGWARPDAALVVALQVDRRFQRQGIARACLQALPTVVQARWPQVRCLQLSVAPDNQAALGLYDACGWQDSGCGHRAHQGYEHCMTLPLDAPPARAAAT